MLITTVVTKARTEGTPRSVKMMRRRVWIGLQLAPQAQYLHVDAAIEDIFVDPGRLKKVFAGKRSLRSVEKRNQQRILAFGQRDRDSVGIIEAAARRSSCQPPNRQRPLSGRAGRPPGRLASDLKGACVRHKPCR
jgi:hypothetical protein